jgi:hypothetical protein
MIEAIPTSATTVFYILTEALGLRFRHLPRAPNLLSYCQKLTGHDRSVCSWPPWWPRRSDDGETLGLVTSAGLYGSTHWLDMDEEELFQRVRHIIRATKSVRMAFFNLRKFRIVFTSKTSKPFRSPKITLFCSKCHVFYRETVYDRVHLKNFKITRITKKYCYFTPAVTFLSGDRSLSYSP